MKLTVAHRLVSTSSGVRWWPVRLEEFVVHQTLHPRICVPVRRHHERRRHRVHVLSSGLVAVIRILPVVITIALESAGSSMVSRYSGVLVSGLIVAGACWTTVGVGVRLSLVLLLLLLVGRLEIVLTIVLVRVLVPNNGPLLTVNAVVVQLTGLTLLILPAVRCRAAVVSGAYGVIVFTGPGVTPTLASFPILVLHRAS